MFSRFRITYVAVASLLSPLGYSLKEVYDAVRGYHHKTLTGY